MHNMISALSVFLCLAPLALAAPLLERALPTPVSVATAKTYLSELTVAVDSNSPAYARADFKTWDTSCAAILGCSLFTQSHWADLVELELI